MLGKIIGCIVIVIGIFAGIQFFSAGSAMNTHGKELTGLQSQAGNTIAEVYYQEIGNLGIATSQAYYGFGAAIIAITLASGAYLLGANKSTLTNSSETKKLIPPNSWPDINKG